MRTRSFASASFRADMCVCTEILSKDLAGLVRFYLKVKNIYGCSQICGVDVYAHSLVLSKDTGMRSGHVQPLRVSSAAGLSSWTIIVAFLKDSLGV